MLFLYYFCHILFKFIYSVHAHQEPRSDLDVCCTTPQREATPQKVWQKVRVFEEWETDATKVVTNGS